MNNRYFEFYLDVSQLPYEDKKILADNYIYLTSLGSIKLIEKEKPVDTITGEQSVKQVAQCRLYAFDWKSYAKIGFMLMNGVITSEPLIVTTAPPTDIEKAFDLFYQTAAATFKEGLAIPTFPISENKA